MSTDKVAELRAMMVPDGHSAFVTHLWEVYNSQRQVKMAEYQELKKYLFATDTTTTANKALPWTHTTTMPKLTQIRDNLHANYISSLFPNDRWLTWQAYSKDAARRNTAKTIESYMETKTRVGGFKNTMSKLALDYIDYGNCFAMPTFENRQALVNNESEMVNQYVGPKLVRISPEDIVFNPLAEEFENTFKIVRSIKTLGEIKKMIDTHPGNDAWRAALERREFVRETMRGYTTDQFEKATQYQVDGFGSLSEYYQSEYIEIFEFWGDYHDAATGELTTDRLITVVDRSHVIRDVEIPTLDKRAPIYHTGWRKRPDNLWAMGPLDNLVGMQYMIDHIQNMKANAMDLMIMSPKVIQGVVDEFDWAPNAEIHVNEDGNVTELAQNLSVIFTADQEIQFIEDKMELYAGAPREQMGVRSPGEKTAFEVQSLENAAGRIFQEKVLELELFMEDCLNGMLKATHMHMDEQDVIRVVDDEYGAENFVSVSKDEINANGILRPVGARHFAQRAQELQNLLGIMNTPLGQKIDPHMSAKGLTNFVEDVVNLNGYSIFLPNIGLMEQQETMGLMQQMQEDTAMVDGPVAEGDGFVA